MFAIYLDLENQVYIVVEVPRMIDILRGFIYDKLGF